LGYCGSHYQQWRIRKELKPIKPNTKKLSEFCSVPDCGRRYWARGLCKVHREHINKYGEVREIKRYNLDAPCNIKGCGQPALAKFRCPKHLQYGYNLSRFGITLEDFVRMLEAQGGVCAICGGVNANGKALSVDHDHGCCPGDRSCGACVRGLLCANCNFMLGSGKDDPGRLRAAAAYIESRRVRVIA
jgi:hypothetical protein